MKFVNKFIALLVLMTVICGCFASCEILNPNGGDVDNLQSGRYVANIKIKYATNDEKMKAAINSIGTPIATLSVNGDDIMLVTNAALNNVSVSDEYIYVGGILYHSNSLTLGENSYTSQECAAMDSEKCDSLISKAGPGASIGLGDFLLQEKNTSGSLVSYTCSEMTDESKESLCTILSDSFQGLNAIVRIGDVSYQLEVLDGRNNSSMLSCDLVITMDGVDYDVTMRLYYEYDYDTEVKITTPQGTYTEVSLDEIMD